MRRLLEGGVYKRAAFISKFKIEVNEIMCTCQFKTMRYFSILNCMYGVLFLYVWGTIFLLPYIIMDLPIFVIAEWATLLVDIRCPRGGS